MMFWYMSYGVAPPLVQCIAASKLPLPIASNHASWLALSTVAVMPIVDRLSLMIVRSVW